MGKESPFQVVHCQHSLPKADSPEVQRIADEDPDHLSAYNNYEEKLTAFKDKLHHVRVLACCCPMHPIGEFVFKSPSAYTRASSATTSPMSVHSLNIMSSLPCEFSIYHLHSLHANLFSVLFSQEVQRSNTETQRTPLKTLLSS